MKGFPCRKFSISWKGARFQGLSSGFLLAGTQSVPLSETRGSGSCLEAGGNDTGVFLPNNKGQTVGEKYSGIEFLLTPGRAPASGSPLEGTPVPRYGVFRVRSQDRSRSYEKWKTSDKDNLPYLRIWKSSTYSSRLRPALGRLYKANLNRKARDRHFKA
ncbi:hypothetical protein F2Q69_00042046 [Brassica cretica]|uniref:Uncharacterized protein n=1 Tax=Brassica cretica TaxID=69181 RepID=A0A8S9NAD3_BRACR|nr:hypothetical protein F2Q69_00042046 [Brassica cretica]